MCACITVVYTTQHRTVLIILPLIPQTTITAEMLPTWRTNIINRCRFFTLASSSISSATASQTSFTQFSLGPSPPAPEENFSRWAAHIFMGRMCFVSTQAMSKHWREYTALKPISDLTSNQWPDLQSVTWPRSVTWSRHDLDQWPDLILSSSITGHLLLHLHQLFNASISSTLTQ